MSQQNDDLTWLARNVHSWTMGDHQSTGAGSTHGEVLGDWRDTLEKRPADLSEPAVTKRLDEATQIVRAAVPELVKDKYKFELEPPVARDWFDRGELPPVGSKIEAWFDDGKECWHGATVIGASPFEDGVVAVSLHGRNDRLLYWCHRFRPIRSERDILTGILFKHCSSERTQAAADAILAAGFKRGGS